MYHTNRTLMLQCWQWRNQEEKKLCRLLVPEKKKMGNQNKNYYTKIWNGNCEAYCTKGGGKCKKCKAICNDQTTRRPDALLTYLNLFIREQDKAVDKLLSGSSRRVLTASQKQLEDRWWLNIKQFNGLNTTLVCLPIRSVGPVLEVTERLGVKASFYKRSPIQGCPMLCRNSMQIGHRYLPYIQNGNTYTYPHCTKKEILSTVVRHIISSH